MKMFKKFILFAMALCVTVPGVTAEDKYAELSSKDINDLPLIYIGSPHRSKWNKEILTPYVVHTFEDGHKSWMFDGFLILEFVLFSEDGKENFSIDGAWPYGQDSKKEHWETVLKNQLGLHNNTGCAAIDQLIDEYIPVLGAPTRKHKVVFSVPTPLRAFQYWGEINGERLNFEKIEDRIKAQKWFIDLIVEEWKKADFKHLELDGIYWVSEAPEFGQPSGQMATQINEYVHSLGMKTYWIPYYAVTSRDKWREMGFDLAYTQPNYAFDVKTPHEQLENAVTSAFDIGHGVEMEFEGYDFSIYDGVYTKQPNASCSLYDIHPELYDHVKGYVDEFERQEVYEYLPIAYYAGYQAFYDFVNSPNAKDRELIERMAKHIERRHITTDWYTPKSGGIGNVEPDKDFTVFGGDGFIYIGHNSGENAEIYALDGRRVAAADSEALLYGTSVACAPGVYVVRCGHNAIKVAVK